MRECTLLLGGSGPPPSSSALLLGGSDPPPSSRDGLRSAGGVPSSVRPLTCDIILTRTWTPISSVGTSFSVAESPPHQEPIATFLREGMEE